MTDEDGGSFFSHGAALIRYGFPKLSESGRQTHANLTSVIEGPFAGFRLHVWVCPELPSEGRLESETPNVVLFAAPQQDVARVC